MAVPLLATKFSVPPARRELVSRSRLIARLNVGLVQDGQFTRRLSLVCAPPGFGKTTLVSEWLRRKPGTTGVSRWGTLLMGLFGTCSVTFSLLWLPAVFLIGMRAGEPAPGYGVTFWMKLAFSLALISAALTPGLIYVTWRAWKEGVWTAGRRVQYTVITVTAAVLIAFNHYWNLLGFRY
jgi:hypothetical protein